jgi:hypothetical protein
MSIHFAVLPKGPHDLALAPVAVTIDQNRRLLRASTPSEIAVSLEVALNRPERSGSPTERASRVLEVAMRDVELHGWRGEITSDATRLRLSGGSVTLDLGLSNSLREFITARESSHPASAA